MNENDETRKWRHLKYVLLSVGWGLFVFFFVSFWTLPELQNSVWEKINNNKTDSKFIRARTTQADHHHHRTRAPVINHLHYSTGRGLANQLISLYRIIPVSKNTNRSIILPPIHDHFSTHDSPFCQPTCNNSGSGWMNNVEFAASFASRIQKEMTEQQEQPNGKSHNVSFYKAIFDIDKLSELVGVDMIDLTDFVKQHPETEWKHPTAAIDIYENCTTRHVRNFREQQAYFEQVYQDFPIAVMGDPWFYNFLERESQNVWNTFPPPFNENFLSSVVPLWKKLFIDLKVVASVYLRVPEKIPTYDNGVKTEIDCHSSDVLSIVQSAVETFKLEGAESGTIYVAGNSAKTRDCFELHFSGTNYTAVSLSQIAESNPSLFAGFQNMQGITDDTMNVLLDLLFVSLARAKYWSDELFTKWTGNGSTFLMLIQGMRKHRHHHMKILKALSLVEEEA